MTQSVSKLHQSPWNPSPSRVLKIGQFLCCLHCCTESCNLCWWMISKLSLHRLLPPWIRGSAPLILRYLDSFVLLIHLFEKYRSIFTFHFIVYFNSLLFVCWFFILDWKILKGRPPSLYLSPFSLCLLLAHMRCLLKAWKVKLTWALNTAEQAWLISTISLSCVSVWNLCAVCLVTCLCLTLCDPIDCRLPGSSVHGILQARILEWVVIPFSRVSSWPRNWTQVSWVAGRYFTIWATRDEFCYFNLREGFLPYGKFLWLIHLLQFK